MSIYSDAAKKGAKAVEQLSWQSWQNGDEWGRNFERNRISAIFEAYGRLCKINIITEELDRCMLHLRDGSCLCPQIRQELANKEGI